MSIPSKSQSCRSAACRLAAQQFHNRDRRIFRKCASIQPHSTIVNHRRGGKPWAARVHHNLTYFCSGRFHKVACGSDILDRLIMFMAGDPAWQNKGSGYTLGPYYPNRATREGGRILGASYFQIMAKYTSVQSSIIREANFAGDP